MDQGELPGSLWHNICLYCGSRGISRTDKAGNECLVFSHGAAETVFGIDTLQVKKKYSLEQGRMELLYSITDPKFISIVLGDLRNAGYIAEDEKGEKHYLGAELRGHVFQKYLPGQFFTFGGKYYEMLRVTSAGQVLVRRAADHITGRPAYRQIRNYYLSNVVDSEAMGDQMDIAGMHIVRQYADIRVETPAYWKLDQYNNFAGGSVVSINGVPNRVYQAKQLLRITLPDRDGMLTKEICGTVALLFNEIFRTLFAENQPYIAAVMPGEAAAPTTYSLQGENGTELEDGCIYIIEDSQLDLGLLVTVQRSLNRIFSILCDYLDWHMEAMELSMNPPPAQEPLDFTAPPAEEEPQPKKGFFRRLFQKIGNFFRKLFRRKPKENTMPPLMSTAPGGLGTEAPPSDDTSVTKQPEPTSPLPEEPFADQPVEAGAAVPDAAIEERSDEVVSDQDIPAEEIAEDADPAPIQENPAPVEQNSLHFEPEQVQAGGGSPISRKPYHLRCYLLYGGTQVPEQIDVQGTRDYLEALGFGNSELKQARAGRDTAERIGQDILRDGSRCCDFCGVELTGTEYEILSDGRDRCITCSRTAVKTEEEFRAIYQTVVQNLGIFYGAKISASVRVEMVNAQKHHRRLGKRFVPTGKSDGRVLGVAIRDKKGYTILVENGAPRMQSTMTIAHELIHIWQYLNWDSKAILKLYGKAQEIEIYEGMAKWGEIQYAYLIGERALGKREELLTRMRDDEYGRGFNKYLARYPLSTDVQLPGQTPFTDKQKPLYCSGIYAML